MKIRTKIAVSIIAIMAIASADQLTAAPVVRQGGGANAAAIQAIVDQFRADLGGANNGVGGSFRTGRREINWDGVPDSFSEPNNLPLDFFNVNSPRGVIFNAIEDATGAALNQFAVSSTTASGVPVRFGNLNASYTSIFQTFSAQRLFIARNTHIMEVNFVIPGTNTPATVSGFGVVFTDVDSSTGGGRSLIRVYGPDGRQLSAASAPVSNNGLSFVGISFNAGERISRVVIESGNTDLDAANTDGTNGVDVVAMDDFIYGEPRAESFHQGDFDGDGTADISVFRPSTGNWFILNSGTNTVTVDLFGQVGDIPMPGDYDGDKLADTAVFRAALGQWWFKRSTNGTNFAAEFGSSTDQPISGDFDKDGKADFALYRPSNNQWLIARSSDNYTSFFGVPFGAAGDVPIGSAIEPAP